MLCVSIQSWLRHLWESRIWEEREDVSGTRELVRILELTNCRRRMQMNLEQCKDEGWAWGRKLLRWRPVLSQARVAPFNTQDFRVSQWAQHKWGNSLTFYNSIMFTNERSWQGHYISQTIIFFLRPICSLNTGRDWKDKLPMWRWILIH